MHAARLCALWALFVAPIISQAEHAAVEDKALGRRNLAEVQIIEDTGDDFPALPLRRKFADAVAAVDTQTIENIDGSVRISVPGAIVGTQSKTNAGASSNFLSDVLAEDSHAQKLTKQPRLLHSRTATEQIFGASTEDASMQGSSVTADEVLSVTSQYVPITLPSEAAAWQLVGVPTGAMREVPEPVVLEPPAPSKKYLVPMLCKGFSNQIMAFVDSVTLAVHLNVTLVLPKWYKHYDYLGLSQEKSNSWWTQFTNTDPQGAHVVDMSYFFDVPAFLTHMNGVLDIVSELPPWLQGDETAGRQRVIYMEADRSSLLLPFTLHLERHDVLRTKCMLHTMMYTTPEMGQLHKHVLLGLRPSIRVVNLVEKALVAMQAVMGGSQGMFLGLHLRHEDDWQEYCKRELEFDPKGQLSGMTSYAECYVDTEEVAGMLKSRGITKHIKVAYVASSALREIDQSLLEASGLKVMHKWNTWALETDGRQFDLNRTRELAAAVDFFIMRLSDVFMGNSFSSFSWLVREFDYLSRDDKESPPRALYYNQPLLFTSGDVQPVEAKRWNVSPLVLQPGWDLPQADEGLQQGHDPDEACISTACQKQWLARHTQHGARHQAPNVTDVQWLDSGFVVVRGNVGYAPEFVRLKFDDTVVSERWANLVDLSGLHSFVLEVEVAVEYKIVSVEVCCGQKHEVCTAPSDFVISHRIKRSDSLPPAVHTRHPTPTTPIVYMHFPHKYASGGPEALHQLHNAINKLFREGRLTVRSKYPVGQALYKTLHSDYGPREFHPGILTPYDYIIVPEHMGMQQPWLDWKDIRLPYMPLIWHLGQHTARTALDTADKPGFKPMCLTEYFARRHSCGAKAIVNTPMADVFYEKAADYARTTDGSGSSKEDLILFDADDFGYLDVSKIKVPPGARLMELAGFKRQELPALYSRAKILIDSYVTGMERALFEAVLFDVVPLVVHHGTARDTPNMPIPEQYRWKPWDYNELNSKIAAVLEGYADAVTDIQLLKTYSHQMPELFEQQVLRYFSDDVLLRFNAVPQDAPAGLAMHERQHSYTSGALQLLAAAIGYPFATADILTDAAYYWAYDVTGVLDELDNAGYARSYMEVTVMPEYKAFGDWAQYLQPPDMIHRRTHCLMVPKHMMLLHPDVVAHMRKLGRVSGTDIVFGPRGLLLVPWKQYFAAVTRHLPSFRRHGFTFQLLEKVLQQEGLTYTRVAAEDIDSSCDHVALDVGQSALDACGCAHMDAIAQQPLWLAASAKLVEGDRVLQWWNTVLHTCHVVQQQQR